MWHVPQQLEELNSGCQAWWQVPLLAELSSQPQYILNLDPTKSHKGTMDFLVGGVDKVPLLPRLVLNSWTYVNFTL